MTCKQVKVNFRHHVNASQQAYKMAAVVWDFFKVSEEDNSLAVCNKCSRKIPRGGRSGTSFNTSNLRSHLQHNHRFDGVLKAYEDACTAKDGNKPAAKKSPGLTPIGEAFEKSKKFTRDDTRAKAIGDLIMDMMALDDQPFTLVEDRGFTRLVNHLEPRFTMPSRRYFADVCLPAKYAAIAKCIHALIDDDNNNDISFTMDMDSERLFSAAGHVMTKERNRLSCEKAEMLLFIKKNLPLIHPELEG